MGWNSWNHYHCSVNEHILRNMSKLFQTTGASAAGYAYVNIDDCWQARFRDFNGTLQPDPRIFPSGIPALTSAIHGDGNKFGIYVDQGYRTCQNRPGTLDNELKDAQTFAAWGVDYVKNDACYPQTPNIKGGGINQNIEGVGYLLYERFFESIRATGREIFVSIENPNMVAPWDARNVSHSRRVGGDIGDNFGSVIGEFHTSPNVTASRAGPGFYNDLDMLEVGNGGQNKTEYITHFSLWCIAKAPLLLGCDLSAPMCKNGTAADIFEIILNKEAIAVSQDPLATPASLVTKLGPIEVWSGPLTHGDKVLLFLNPTPTDVADISFAVSALSFGAGVSEVTCRDIWLHGPCVAGASFPTADHNISVSVTAHGVVMMRLTQKTAAAQRLAAVQHITAEEATDAAVKAATVSRTYHTALHHFLPTQSFDVSRHSSRRDRQYGDVSHPTGEGPASTLTPPLLPLPLLTANTTANPPTNTAAAAASAAAAVAGWPMRGYDSAHSGRTPFKGPVSCPRVKWEQTLGQSKYDMESSPAVDQAGRVFVGSGTCLWALKLDTGEVIWKFDTRISRSASSEFFASPALVGGAPGGDNLVLVGAGSGTMYAFNAASGKVVWSFQTADVVVGKNGGTGKAPITGSVVVGRKEVSMILNTTLVASLIEGENTQDHYEST
jgi:alpha-galactosidase